MAKWVVKEKDPKTFEVSNGRGRRSTHPSLGDAIEAIKKKFDPTKDTVTHEAPDGYRMSLTKQMSPRQGWRQR